MLLIASVAFVLFISIFPLIGSLTVSGFPLQAVMLDNLHLLILLCVISLPLGLCLGIIAGRLKRKRIFWMILLGLLFYWTCILLIILFTSKSFIIGTDFSDVLRISIWAMLAYSLFAVPFVILAVFFIERWTRK